MEYYYKAESLKIKTLKIEVHWSQKEKNFLNIRLFLHALIVLSSRFKND